MRPTDLDSQSPLEVRRRSGKPGVESLDSEQFRSSPKDLSSGRC